MLTWLLTSSSSGCPITTGIPVTERMVARSHWVGGNRGEVTAVGGVGSGERLAEARQGRGSRTREGLPETLGYPRQF